MNEGKTPLLKALKDNVKHEKVSFHMPGHKRGKGISGSFSEMMRQDPFSLDMTEIPALDDLHNPTGPIKEAQERSATLFGADKSFFLVNGTTVGIHAAILGVCKPGEEILVPRDIHRSVMGGCILSGVMPRYIKVSVNADYFIPLPVSVRDVSEALDKNPFVKALLQVYPSYYGLTGDMPGIIDIAHKRNIPVIIDEAHGAHFKFSSELPATGLECGADICVQSTHKTLGAFTQASTLHVKGSLVNAEEISRQLKILQTTSPSYLLMASLDAATGHMEDSGTRMMDRAISIAQEAREQINLIPGLRCLGSDVIDEFRIHRIDPTKLLISVRDIGLTGHEAAAILRNEHHIQVELSDRYNILCMFSIGSTSDDAVLLIKALTEIAGQKKITPRVVTISGEIPVPPGVLTPRDAWFAPKRQIAIDDSAGKVSAETIAPYPPGIPLICPGEEITYEILNMIKELKGQENSFHGPMDPEINFITVVDN